MFARGYLAFAHELPLADSEEHRMRALLSAANALGQPLAVVVPMVSSSGLAREAESTRERVVSSLVALSCKGKLMGSCG